VPWCGGTEHWQALQIADFNTPPVALKRPRTKGSWVQILPGAPILKGQQSLALSISVAIGSCRMTAMRKRSLTSVCDAACCEIAR
jgi:hypothetical protein